MADTTTDTTQDLSADTVDPASVSLPPADDATSQTLMATTTVSAPQGTVEPQAVESQGEVQDNAGPDNAGQMPTQIDDYAILSQQSIYANTRFA